MGETTLAVEDRGAEHGPTAEDPRRDRDLLGLYLSEIRGFPRLSLGQEQELAARIAVGDADAERRMVEANLRLVVVIAKRYQRSGLPLLDLIQEGNVGLLAAVRRFRPDRARFSTFGVWAIRMAILRALASRAHVIGRPLRAGEVLGEWRRTRDRLAGELGREPSVEEIGEVTGTKPERIAELEVATQQVISLDAPIGDADDVVLGDVLESQEPDPMTVLLRKEERERAEDLVGSGLRDGERLVLRAHLGLDGGDDSVSLAAIGRHLGLSRERVRQVKKAGLKKVRERLLGPADNGDEPAEEAGPRVLVARGGARRIVMFGGAGGVQ